MNNNIFLKALNKQNYGNNIPIWFLRQSGRYLPEYRILREKYKFLNLIKTPDLIIELTILPFKYFELDVAIIFSDISLIYDIIEGVSYDVIDNIGPIIKLNKDINNLRLINPAEKLEFLKKPVIEVKNYLKKPLIGFSPGLYTTISYLFKNYEKSKKNKENKVKELIYSENWKNIISFFSKTILRYIEFLNNLGFDAIQIFDSFLFELSKFEFNYYFKDSYINILNEFKRNSKTPIIFFCLDTIYIVDFLNDLNIDCLSVDFKENLLFYFYKTDKAIQGNLDPFLLTLNINTFRSILKRSFKNIFEKIKGEENIKKRYIFNVGHGLKSNTLIDNIKFLIDYMKNS
jgi:uroporphyrinogen decarboxylase